MEWEQAHHRSFFASSTGVSPVDVVWTQAARQEAGTAKGEAAGMVLEDLASFYETIDRDLLAQEAAALNFPLDIVRASMAAYGLPRMVALHGRLAREVHPRRGVIAGCTFATTYVRVFMLRALDRAVKEMPDGVSLDVYIDDVVISAVGEPKEVTDKLLKAHATLRRIIQEELGCTFAKEKTAVVASDREMTRRLKEGVGATGIVVDATPNLGIDANAAKPRGSMGRRAMRRTRLAKALARGKRLAKLRYAIGSRATRIYRAGAEKAGTYGAEVWGLSDVDAHRLRKLAATTLRPKGRGRSLTLALLLAGAPTSAAEIAPVVQYHRMIWKGVTNRELAKMRGASLGTISQWWNDTSEYANGIVDDSGYDDGQLAGGGGGGGDAAGARGRRGSTRAWRKVRGPLAAAHLTLRRIGWRFAGPFELTDDRGNEVSLTKSSPSMVKDLLVDGVRRSLERKVGAKWAISDKEFAGRRICVDLALREMSRKGNNLTRMQVGAFRSSLCGALMTFSRASRLGYQVEDACPLCGTRGDTVHHRTFKCEKTREAVLNVVPEWLYEEAGRQSPSSLFWTTGVMPHPGDTLPPPHPGVPDGGRVLRN